ncbi:MAG TPA: L-histidine N(alpha)-methyltransferase [Longimicrobiales bacterium]|nr:L-histidine N(alpha)-methyltransferase [Longimicrobiales bacterium]
MPAGTGDLRAEVLRGLTAARKTLPCKFLYDERGAGLFERISELPEYYPTRTELQILRRYLPEIRDLAGPRVRVIEPGSGSGAKTRLLLHGLDSPVEYVPIDISEAQLLAWAETLRREFPGLGVHPLCADYTAEFVLPAPDPGVRRTIAFFPGSTIGNFEPPEARSFLRRLGGLCGRNGAILIGVDLRKSRRQLEQAYDDAQGVTAEFNLNLLRRINRECGGDFDLSAFRHRAIYDEDRGRIEMHLVSDRPQVVRIDDDRGGAHTLAFEAGEVIVTEHSYKYSVEGFTALAAEAGYASKAAWVDDEFLFSVHWLQPRHTG